MKTRPRFVYAPTATRWLWRVVFFALLAPLVWYVADGVGLFPKEEVSQAAPDSSCLPGRAVPIMEYPHISQREAKDVVYNSNPPSSGPHFAASVAPGIYRSHIPSGQSVHALEHGRVVIHYLPDTPNDIVAELESITKQYAPNVILTPDPDIDSAIGLAAWGRVDALGAFDEERIVAFVERNSRRYNHSYTTKAYGC